MRAALVLALGILVLVPSLTVLAATPATFTIDPMPSNVANHDNAGEPSIGVNWHTGKILFQAGTRTYRFDEATRAWNAVTPPNSILNIDPILFTDSATGRTFAGGLEGPCSVLAYSDNDGAQWVPVTNACTYGAVDHETVGGGAFASPLAGGTPAYANVVYYCAQTGLEPSPALCAASYDGGLTFQPPTATWVQSCWSIHGHVKVGPDGWAYLPSRNCGATQGGALSSTNGATWQVFRVPGITSTSQFDPSVAVGGTSADPTLYYCARDGSGRARVATSTDHAAHWSAAVDVGAAAGLVNIEFPAMVAGDADRAACAFLGTTTPGDTQSASFAGVWHLYVAFTYDRGATWTLVDATGSDPVQRGCVWNGQGGPGCRNMLDFMDAQLTRDGRVIVGFADGCTSTCVTSPTSTAKSAWGTLARQTGGTPLYASP